MIRRGRTVGCPDRVLSWIPWVVDGGLTLRQKAIVVAHAEECPGCRGELDIVCGAPLEIGPDLPDPDRLFEKILSQLGLRGSARPYRGSHPESVGSGHAGRLG